MKKPHQKVNSRSRSKTRSKSRSRDRLRVMDGLQRELNERNRSDCIGQKRGITND